MALISFLLQLSKFPCEAFRFWIDTPLAPHRLLVAACHQPRTAKNLGKRPVSSLVSVFFVAAAFELLLVLDFVSAWAIVQTATNVKTKTPRTQTRVMKPPHR